MAKEIAKSVSAQPKCALVEPSSSMQQCIDCYGIEGAGEWINNSISTEAQFWSCGMISRKAASPKHEHDPEELARCRLLAYEAASILGDVWPWFRSGSDPNTQPFFVAAQLDAVVPKKVNEKLIRATLGGTLHPSACVEIEPFAEGTKWWQEIEEDVKQDCGETEFDNTKGVRKWRELIRWFHANSLSSPSFVRTTDSVEVSHTLGCVYPCLILGVSDKGSLIGVATHVVE